MLSLALIIRDDAAALKTALPALAGLASPTRPLVLIDQSSQDNSRALLRAFMGRYGGIPLVVDTSVSLAEAAALARGQTGTDYALTLTCTDRVNRKGLDSLEQALSKRRPDLLVMASGYWLTDADRPLLGPDAGRADAGDLTVLYPDPRRLVIRNGQCDTPDPGDDPRTAWHIWQHHVGTAKQALFHPDPVLLRALPRHGAAASLKAIVPLLANLPKADRSITLSKVLPWLSDALSLAPPDSAAETLAAAQGLLRTLPRALRRQACADPGSIGTFLTAVRSGGDGLAHLALLAMVRSELHTRALAAEYAALRHDLSAALPGPDYLRDLHAQLRGQ